MIAIVFLLILVVLTVVMSLMGVGPGNILIGESLLLVGLFVLLFVESLLLVLAGRGRDAEALLHARTYQEEAAEALEAVGAVPEDRAR